MSEAIEEIGTIKIGKVPKYLSDKYSLTHTRATVYNWIHRGHKNGIKLRSALVKSNPNALFPTVYVTRKEWVDDYLRATGTLL